MGDFSKNKQLIKLSLFLYSYFHNFKSLLSTIFLQSFWVKFIVIMIQCIKANIFDEHHGKEIVRLLSTYATDPMGGQEDLSEYVKNNLISELQKREK